MKRISIIDDSDLVLKLAKRVLEDAGYLVETFTDAGFFDPTTGAAPDLLLVDVNMPEFYGDDIVTFIKDTWNLTVPILLYSNRSEEELADAVRRCGADGYISKQWGLEQLVQKVQEILGANSLQSNG
jgi:DNA-binding response OmpR family regulator